MIVVRMIIRFILSLICSFLNGETSVHYYAKDNDHDETFLSMDELSRNISQSFCLAIASYQDRMTVVKTS